jgi:hypothetical protein
MMGTAPETAEFPRVRRDGSDGSAIYYSAEVWTASGYGSTWDSAGGFNADSTWNVVAPWAP